MRTIVTSVLPFPNIYWWLQVPDIDLLVFDKQEHFRKMTSRNRYWISGSNNAIQLSIPLQNGRDQRTVMQDVKIHNGDNWQINHWRSLVSVYKRSPYFEYYEPSLQKIFETPFEYLIDFSKITIQWTKHQLKLKYEETETEKYIHPYPDSVLDLRFLSKESFKDHSFKPYYQVFQDRIGFKPNLCILDLLFSLGPATSSWLKENRK